MWLIHPIAIKANNIENKKYFFKNLNFKKMRKIVLATTLLVALGITSFANRNEDNKKLFNDLTNAFKNASHAQSSVQWLTTGNYREATFVFKGKSIFAYFNLENDELIGFSRPLAVNDLPNEALTNIQKNYGDWAINEAMMFLYGDGRVNYYVNVNKGKNNIVFEITTKGKVSMFSKMSF
jgi:hypothetical protein